MTKPLRILIAITLASSLALPALAQETGQGPDEDQGQEEERPRVTDIRFIFVEGSLPFVPTSNTIATKLPLELRSTPFNVGIVTSPLFDEQYGLVLSEAITNISNINVQSGFGVHDFFVIRGFDSLSSSLVLTDGASEPEVTFYHLYNVEVVETLKGPSGFLYGSNPLAGTVNLVRKQPLPATSTSFSGTLGSYDHYRGNLDVNYGSDDYSFRLNSFFLDSGSFRDDKERQNFAINPAFTWRARDEQSLTVNFEYVYADYIPDSGIPLAFGQFVPDVPSTQNYQSPIDTSEQDIYRFQADYEFTVNDWLTVRDKFYYRDLDWLSNGTLLNGIFPTPVVDPNGNIIGFQDLVFRTLILLDDRQKLIGNQFEAIFDFSTGSVEHSLLAGLEVSRFADAFTFDVALLAPLSVDDPVEPPLQDLVLLPGQSSAGDSRSLVAAPYFIDQMWFSDKFQLLVGARVDAIDFEDQLNGVSRDDTKVSPMFGAVFAPDDELSFYGNFSRSFAPPTARVQDGERVPEEAEQWEGGVRKEFLDGRARTAFAVYQIERDNIPIFDDNGFTQQIGSQRSRGFEIEFAIEPTNRLRAIASYAYNNSELTNFNERVLIFETFPPTLVIIDRSGNDPAFAPKHILNFWLSHDFANGLGIGGGGRYVGEQFIAEDNIFVIGDVLIFDAAVSYTYDYISLQLNLKNLTDRDYFTRGFGANSVIPADPITVYVGVGFRI